MSKKFYIVLTTILLSGLLVAPVWAAEYSELEKKIEDLTQSVSQLEGLVKDLAFQLQQTQAVTSIVKEVSYEVKKLESNVKDLQNINKKFDELQPRILTIEGTIQGLAASMKEKFSVFQGRVFDLETSVQGLDARLKSVESKIRELFSLEDKIKAVSKRVSEIEAKLAKPHPMPPSGPGKEQLEALRMELMGQIYELEDSLQALQNEVAALPFDKLSAQIGDLSGQIDRNRSRITSLEVNKADTEEIDALNAKIAQLEQQMQSQIEQVRSQTNTNMILAGMGIAVGLAALASVFGIF
jgi:DNA repair exonuclease SbcCD ATPase subunit